MLSSGILRRMAVVRTDVSEEYSASIIRVTRIGELGTELAITSIRRKLRRNIYILIFIVLLTFFLAHRLFSPSWWRHCFLPKRRILQEIHGVTFQNTTFFIVTAMKTSNFTQCNLFREQIKSLNKPWFLNNFRYFERNSLKWNNF
jgi:hypothetical protein